MDEWGQAAYNTLPKSFREQNIVTAVKENLDPEELARNQELTRSKTPAELAQIHSLSEFPLPDNIKNSCVDSLVSCAETLVGDSDPNLETCAETLRDEDQTEFFSDDDLDNPYPAVDFDQMMAQGPGAGAQIIDRPGRSSVKKSESGRRLQEGTEQLSMELMEHVESLKTTLDNMSSRLGTRSRSRSHSKSRHSSQYRPSEQ